MHPIRQVLDDAPDAIPVPAELRHRRIEIILWPLDEAPTVEPPAVEYERGKVEKIVIPSRDERNARR